MLDLGMAYCANRSLQDVFYLGETAWHDDTAAEAAALPQPAEHRQLLWCAVLSVGQGIRSERPVPRADPATAIGLCGRALRTHRRLARGVEGARRR